MHVDSAGYGAGNGCEQPGPLRPTSSPVTSGPARSASYCRNRCHPQRSHRRLTDRRCASPVAPGRDRTLFAKPAVPLAAPSANRFMHLSPTEARHVRESALAIRVDMVLDGGPPPSGSNPQCSRWRAPLHAPAARHDLACGTGGAIGPVAIAATGGDGASRFVARACAKSTTARRPLSCLTAESPATGRGAFVWWSRKCAHCRDSVRMPSESRRIRARNLFDVARARSGRISILLPWSPYRYGGMGRHSRPITARQHSRKKELGLEIACFPANRLHRLKRRSPAPESAYSSYR